MYDTIELVGEWISACQKKRIISMNHDALDAVDIEETPTIRMLKSLKVASRSFVNSIGLKHLNGGIVGIVDNKYKNRFFSMVFADWDGVGCSKWIKN